MDKPQPIDDIQKVCLKPSACPLVRVLLQDIRQSAFERMQDWTFSVGRGAKDPTAFPQKKISCCYLPFNMNFRKWMVEVDSS